MLSDARMCLHTDAQPKRAIFPLTTGLMNS